MRRFVLGAWGRFFGPQHLDAADEPRQPLPLLIPRRAAAAMVVVALADEACEEKCRSITESVRTATYLEIRCALYRHLLAGFPPAFLSAAS